MSLKWERLDCPKAASCIEQIWIGSGSPPTVGVPAGGKTGDFGNQAFRGPHSETLAIEAVNGGRV